MEYAVFFSPEHVHQSLVLQKVLQHNQDKCTEFTISFCACPFACYGYEHSIMNSQYLLCKIATAVVTFVGRTLAPSLVQQQECRRLAKGLAPAALFKATLGLQALIWLFARRLCPFRFNRSLCSSFAVSRDCRKTARVHVNRYNCQGSGDMPKVVHLLCE